jgi:hypothetical protein
MERCNRLNGKGKVSNKKLRSSSPRTSTEKVLLKNKKSPRRLKSKISKY